VLKATAKLNSLRVTKVALKLFFYVMDEWLIDEHEQMVLLGLPKNVNAKMLRSNYTKILPCKVMKRISLTISIYRSLHSIFTHKNQANTWISKTNSAFNDMTAIGYILKNTDSRLIKVRNYLDFQ